MPSASENILLFVSGFGIIQAFILASLLFFHPRSDKSVNFFLALYIICISGPMFLPVAQQLFSWQQYIYIAPFTLLIGPWLYLYVRSFKETITIKKAWPHFILFFIYLFIIWRLSTTMGIKYPPTKEMPAEVLHNPLTIVPITIRMIQLLFYYFLSRKTLSSYQHSIQHIFSETSKIDLQWVRWLITGYLVLVISFITLYSLVLLYTDNFNLFLVINAAVITPYIYVATFKGITQPTLWQIQPGVNKEIIEQEILLAEKIERYNHKSDHEKPEKHKVFFSNEKFSSIISRIIKVMEEEKLYQEAQLTLQHLADKLQVPSYQVSQAINDGLGKNFYDLINGYRVEEAKRLLTDEKNMNYTILSVGFEAGFNSKTTFNTVFKKFTGYTPTEYRDGQKKTALSA